MLIKNDSFSFFYFPAWWGGGGVSLIPTLFSFSLTLEITILNNIFNYL